MTELAKLKTEILEKNFLHNREFVAVPTMRFRTPFPVKPTNVKRLLEAHVLGPAVPEAQVISQEGCVLKGHFRVGGYLLDKDNTVRTAAIDYDGGVSHKNPLRDPILAVLRTYDRCKARGLPCYIEKSCSGEGFHLWFFFNRPVQASRVRKLLYSLLDGEQFELANGEIANPACFKGVEIFPKQDALKDGGLGNMIWLPWWHGAKPGNCEFVQGAAA